MGLVAFGPLRPDGLVVKHLQENSAHHGPRGEADFVRVLGLIPIGHRRPIRCRVQKTDDRIQKRLKVSPVLRQGRRPECPIKLGVRLTIIERQAVEVHVFLIEIHFLAPGFRRPEVQAQNPIPGSVVFLTPTTWLVERQTVVIAVIRFLDPTRGKLLGNL